MDDLSDQDVVAGIYSLVDSGMLRNEIGDTALITDLNWTMIRRNSVFIDWVGFYVSFKMKPLPTD